MIRTGIIGLGKMGRIRQSLVERHPEYSLVAVCDRDAPEAPAPGCFVTRDYRELLALDALDAVFVCTTNDVTAEIVVAALDRGKHVFAEKPPGRNMDEVRAIVAAERRNPGVKLKFGFNHRYHESVRQAYAIVQSGRLGRLMWMRGVYGKAGGQGFAAQWRSQREVAGGGILLDQGIHMLDLFRLFCGEFEEARSFVQSAYWDIDVEDNAFVLLRNARGQVASLHSSATQWQHKFLLELFLTGGYLIITGLLTSTRSYGREALIIGRRPSDDAEPGTPPREEVVYFDDDPSWEREIEEFTGSIVSGRGVEVGTAQDALQVMELVQRIYSADAGWESAAAGVAAGQAGR